MTWTRSLVSAKFAMMPMAAFAFGPPGSASKTCMAFSAVEDGISLAGVTPVSASVQSSVGIRGFMSGLLFGLAPRLAIDSVCRRGFRGGPDRRLGATAGERHGAHAGHGKARE